MVITKLNTSSMSNQFSYYVFTVSSSVDYHNRMFRHFENSHVMTQAYLTSEYKDTKPLKQ